MASFSRAGCDQARPKCRWGHVMLIQHEEWRTQAVAMAEWSRQSPDDSNIFIAGQPCDWCKAEAALLGIKAAGRRLR